MTLQARSADEFDASRLRDELLGCHRTEPGLVGVSFAETPVRLLGGLETLIYAFWLAGVQSDLVRPLVVRVFREGAGVGQAKNEAVFQNAVLKRRSPQSRV